VRRTAAPQASCPSYAAGAAIRALPDLCFGIVSGRLEAHSSRLSPLGYATRSPGTPGAFFVLIVYRGVPNQAASAALVGSVIIRRSSAAVATSREGHRSPVSGRAARLSVRPAPPWKGLSASVKQATLRPRLQVLRRTRSCRRTSGYCPLWSWHPPLRIEEHDGGAKAALLQSFADNGVRPVLRGRIKSNQFPEMGPALLGPAVNLK
jgi:hypothetical protein